MSTTVNMPVELSSGLMEKAKELCKGKRIKSEELLQAFEKALPYFRDGGRAGDRLHSYNPKTRRPFAWVVKVGQTNRGGRFVKWQSTTVLKCYSGAKASAFAQALNALHEYYYDELVRFIAYKHQIDPQWLDEIYQCMRGRLRTLSYLSIVESHEFGRIWYNIVGTFEDGKEELLVWGFCSRDHARPHRAALDELRRQTM